MTARPGSPTGRRALVRPMSVAWLVHGPVRQLRGRWVSDLASVRYRATVPGAALAERGHSVRIIPLAGAFDPAAVARQLDADVVVVGKSFRRETEAVIVEAKRRGARIVVDQCDDHFSTPDLAAHQHALVGLADLLVTSTPELACVIHSATGREAHLVPDPYEGPHGKPRFAPEPGERPRLLWFGHPLNLDTVTGVLPSLIALGQRVPLGLRLVTAPLPGLVERFAAFNEAHGARIHVAVVPWNVDATWSELAACDLVVIPSLSGERKKSVKSPNRVVESLRAGRHVVAFPLPSYRDFAQYVSLTPEIARGIARSLTAPDGIRARLNAGQRYVEEHHAPAVAAEAWENALVASLGTTRSGMSVPEAPRRAPAPRVTAPRRIVEHVRPTATQPFAARGRPAAAATSAAIAPRPHPTQPASPASAKQRSASPSQVRALVAGLPAPVRLNLGCGDKILPGYLNVDLVDGRLGHRPDVLCDVRDLTPFPDSCADEILAVHLVEHIWRWEIVDVLRGWSRVLKPGGSLVVECPNLLEACREFLRDPVRASGPGVEGQRTMWVFYGDPRWKDPYMCHRWGYTPESLGAILTDAGLVRVRQEPAQFKLREPRDMRVVAEKPMGAR